MPDDHSDLVPLLPIPNRTVKRVSADDSADSRVKVGHRQAITARKRPPHLRGAFLFVQIVNYQRIVSMHSRMFSCPQKTAGLSNRFPVH